MKHSGTIQLVIPTTALLAEYSCHDVLLAKVGVTVKEMIEMFLTSWEHLNLYPDYPFPFPAHGVEDHHWITQEASVSARLLAADIVFDSFERQQEAGMTPPTADERKQIEFVMMQLWYQIIEYIMDVLTTLGLTDVQRKQLCFERWSGDDVILRVPVHTGRS